MSQTPDITQAVTGPHLPPHLYIHVPFCRVKCSYCDFYSLEVGEKDVIDRYLLAAESEMETWRRARLPGVVDSIYLGGGTPTIIVAGAVRLVRQAAEKFPIREGAEITVEANPDSLTDRLLDALAAAGVTRISLGAQSFIPGEIALLGRVHTTDEAMEAAALVRAAGIGLSVDLMCGIPGQTVATWETSLERAVATGAEHISVYPLTLEEGTALDVAVGTGLVPTPDPDLAAELMIMAEERLRLDGLERYETANYALPGAECRHNIAYWTGASYMGVGPAAHGMLDAESAQSLYGPAPEGSARARLANVSDLASWESGAAPEVEWLDSLESSREDAMLGLRLVRGITDALVDRAQVRPVMEDLERQDLVEHVADRWWTTRRGWLLGNEVFGAVWDGAPPI